MTMTVSPLVTIQIKMFCNWFGDSLGLNGRSVVIDSSAEITCFTYILFLTLLECNVSVTVRGSQYLVAISCYWTPENVRRPAEFAHEASLISAHVETPDW
jgi:hypothetical protein